MRIVDVFEMIHVAEHDSRAAVFALLRIATSPLGESNRKALTLT
jgi:hypothetical protein